LKKVLLVSIVLLSVCGLAFAADSAGAPLFGPGNFSLQADVDIGYGFGVSGGGDFGIGSFKIGPIPFTYGVAARVGYDMGDWNYVALDVLGTVRMSWNSLFPQVGFVNKLESYIGLGLGAGFYSYSLLGVNQTGSTFSVASIEGNNYYITKSLAINLEEGYYGYYGGLKVGVLFKL